MPRPFIPSAPQLFATSSNFLTNLALERTSSRLSKTIGLPSRSCMRAIKVMQFAKKRFTKNLFSERPSQQKPYLTTVADEAAQARYVAQQILKAREAGVPLKEQAVLVRAITSQRPTRTRA